MMTHVECITPRFTEFKTAVLKSSLCDYSDACTCRGNYISCKHSRHSSAGNNNDKKVIYKNFVPLTECIGKINNSQIDNAKDINIALIQ